MAVRLTAKEALARELLRLGEERWDYLKALEDEKHEAARKEYRLLISEADMRIEALRYALNFLEIEEEEPCPD